MKRTAVLLLGLVLIGAPLTGCLDQGTSPDGDPGEDDGSDGVAEPSEPAPAGSSITNEEINDLVDLFDDEPLVGGQGTPKHAFKWVNEEAFLFLHLDDPNPRNATSIDYAGVAVEGVFCQEDKPGEAFTHFHKQNSSSWDGGHGGDPGEEGYWFVHVAVAPHDEPWGAVETGTDYDFMPTPAPECGDDVPDPTFEPNGAGDISNSEIQALLDEFDDAPLSGGQETPKHAFKWVTEDVFLFLHVDTPNPRDANTIHYFGPAIAGQFCDDAQPHEDFTHFHKWEAASWEGGHGGAAGAYGFWFLHNAVTPHDEPWGAVDYGPDRDFMPTPPPSC